MKNKKELSYWILRDLYVTQKKSVKKIARFLDISVSSAYKYLKIFGLMESDIAPNTTKEDCKKCKYSGKLSDGLICNYLHITGELRNCSPRHCLVFEKKERKKRK